MAYDTVALTVPFSTDEQKILLLGLAHLSNFLPEWDGQFEIIAAKLKGGTALYERLKELESEQTLRAVLSNPDLLEPAP